MRFKVIIFLFLFFSGFGFSQNFEGIALSRIQAKCQRWSVQENFSGVILFARGDSILVHQAVGWADPFRKIPADTGKAFMIASLSKAFTAAAVLQLVEKGKLSLDEKIGHYLPEYPSWAGNSITIHQLLCHTSGIPDYINDARLGFWWKERKDWRPTHDQLIGSFSEKSLFFMPGTEFRYSNSGYVLLARIVEEVTGEPFDRYLRANILQPCKMTLSGTGEFERVAYRASAYSLKNEDFQRIPNMANETIFGMGGLYSTTGDLFKWVRGLKNGRVLGDSMLKKMWTPYKEDYGYGWQVYEEKGRKVITHGGYFTGWSSCIFMYPESELTLIALSNSEPADPEQLLRECANVWFENQRITAKVEGGAAPHASRELAGRYWAEGNWGERENATGPCMVWEQKGKIIVIPTVGAKVELLPLGQGHWKNPTLELEADLLELGKGKVLHLEGKGISLDLRKYE